HAFPTRRSSDLTESITSLNGSVNASVPIFQGFQRVNEVAANKYLLLADQTNTERIQSDLVLAVVTTYLEALTNQDLLTAGKQQLTLSKEQLQAEEINFEVGNRTLADLSQAKSQVATDELNVTSAQNAYDISILDLKQLMELDPSTEIVLEQPSLPECEHITTAYSAEEVYLEPTSIYPEIKQASYNTLAAEKNIDIVKGGYYPTLSLSGGLGSGYSSADKDYTTGVERPFHQQIDDNFSTFVGLSLSIPIFNNFQTRIAVKKAKISYENALLGERQAENNLSKVIHQAVVDLRAAEKSYYSNEQAFEASKQAFEVFKQRYEVGLANSIELNTSQTNMNKA